MKTPRAEALKQIRSARDAAQTHLDALRVIRAAASSVSVRPPLGVAEIEAQIAALDRVLAEFGEGGAK